MNIESVKKLIDKVLSMNMNYFPEEGEDFKFNIPTNYGNSDEKFVKDEDIIMRIWDLEPHKYYGKKDSKNRFYIDNDRTLFFLSEDNKFKPVKIIVDYNEVKDWEFYEIVEGRNRDEKH